MRAAKIKSGSCKQWPFYVGCDNCYRYDTVVYDNCVAVAYIVSLYHIVSIYKVSSHSYKCRKAKMQKEQVRIKCQWRRKVAAPVCGMHWPVFCFPLDSSYLYRADRLRAWVRNLQTERRSPPCLQPQTTCYIGTIRKHLLYRVVISQPASIPDDTWVARLPQYRSAPFMRP